MAVAATACRASYVASGWPAHAPAETPCWRDAKRVGDVLSAAGLRRPQLGNHAMTIRYQDRLAVNRRTHVFAQLVLERLDTNGPRGSILATGSHLNQPARGSPSRRPLAPPVPHGQRQ